MKNHQNGKIYLNFNNDCIREKQCALTGDIFDSGSFLAFFLNDDCLLPVSPETALQRGFTMSNECYSKLEEYSYGGFRNVDNQNLVNLRVTLPASLKIWIGIDEMLKKVNYTNPALREISNLLTQLHNSIFSALRSTKGFEFQHKVIGEYAPPYDEQEDSELPF